MSFSLWLYVDAHANEQNLLYQSVSNPLTLMSFLSSFSSFPNFSHSRPNHNNTGSNSKRSTPSDYSNSIRHPRIRTNNYPCSSSPFSSPLFSPPRDLASDFARIASIARQCLVTRYILLSAAMMTWLCGYTYRLRLSVRVPVCLLRKRGRSVVIARMGRCTDFVQLVAANVAGWGVYSRIVLRKISSVRVVRRCLWCAGHVAPLRCRD